ncbi:cell division protein FtsQ/DivIB [bacterium]|nr:cell division protein FtsQ/DivIB [bacterium]
MAKKPAKKVWDAHRAIEIFRTRYGNAGRSRTPTASGAVRRLSPRQPVPRKFLPRLAHYVRAIPNMIVPAAIVLALGLLLVVFWQFLYSSQFFLVTKWQVYGADRLSDEEVVAIAKGQYEDPIHLLGYDLDEAQAKLTAHPALHHAKLRRTWPNQIDILVHERKPEAVLIGKRATYLVDCEGVVFARALPNELLDSRLPILTGPSERTYELGEALDPAFRDNTLLYAGAMAAAGGPLEDRLSEIHWEPGTGITLYLRGGTRLVCGARAPSETLPKAEALAEKLDGLATVDYADLRLDTHVPWKAFPIVPVIAEDVAMSRR